ncbi:hypothetical protein DFH27DRAFT_523201 [Peziza echinospora]|nr:hypothetical protein DFH27DRAFT_523201 [Peziza echinospora]
MAAPSGRRSRHTLASATNQVNTDGATTTPPKRSSQRTQNSQSRQAIDQSDQGASRATRTLRSRVDKGIAASQDQLNSGGATNSRDDEEQAVRVELQSSSNAPTDSIPPAAKSSALLVADSDSSLSPPSGSVRCSSDPVEEEQEVKQLPGEEITITPPPPAARRSGRSRPQKDRAAPIAAPEKVHAKSIRLTFKGGLKAQAPPPPPSPPPPPPPPPPLPLESEPEEILEQELGGEPEEPEVDSSVEPAFEAETELNQPAAEEETELPAAPASEEGSIAEIGSNEQHSSSSPLNTGAASDPAVEGPTEQPSTPTPRKRGRPKGSGKKANRSAKSSPQEKKSIESPEDMNASNTGLDESPTPSGKRGPGRPRKPLVPPVLDADEVKVGEAHEDGDGSSMMGGNPTAAANKMQPPPPVSARRSARERRSAVLPLPVISRPTQSAADSQAPVMGQGDLKTNRALRTGARAAIAREEWLRNGRGEAAEAADVERSREARARPRQFTQKMEAERARRKLVTSILNASQIETFPTFPPEYGFKISYFRAQSPSPPPPAQPVAPAASGNDRSPTPGTSGSLPTPPTTSEDESPDQDRPKKKQKIWTGEVDEGYEPTKGLYTFAPTEAVFREFETFMKEIGQLGRKAGVVRVTVPKGCIPPPATEIIKKKETVVKEPSNNPVFLGPPASRSMGPVARPPSHGSRSGSKSRGPSRPFEMSLSDFQAPDDGNPPLNCFYQCMKVHPKTSNYSPIYSIRTTRVGTYNANTFLSQKEARDQLATESPEDLLETEAYTEDLFVNKCIVEAKRQHPGIVYSTDNEATDELRTMFSLSDLNLVGFSGNSLFKSRNQVAGIHTPYFYFANPGSTFAMHMEDYSALSINYHHWGAPKRWVVVCPTDSERLENMVVGMLDLKPNCDQFIRHESIFIPTKVLARAGIKYTEVEQRPGDMIVTFPWAYHQGWNQGLNVAEAIGYGDKGWEGWVRSYKICGKRCPVPPIKLEFPEDFGKGGYMSVGMGGERGVEEEEEESEESEDEEENADPLLNVDVEANIDVDIGSDDDDEEDEDDEDDEDDDDDDVDVDVQLAGAEEGDTMMDVDVDIGNESDDSDNEGLEMQVQLQIMEMEKMANEDHGNDRDDTSDRETPEADDDALPESSTPGLSNDEEEEGGKSAGNEGEEGGAKQNQHEDVVMGGVLPAASDQHQKKSVLTSPIPTSPLTQPPLSSPPPPP